MSSNQPGKKSILLGAAFLMATSAIGPGFLTQTSLFTQQLGASFGFVILISILLDIGAQLNIWRILAASGLKAQQLANQLAPGLGSFLSVLVALGGLAFNIGNIGGCGLGLNVLTGLDTSYGAILSCVIALGIFWMKEAGSMMDIFTKALGILMIGVTLYVAISSRPPVAEVLRHTIMPEKIDVAAIITLVGGTVGGYISFAGAHRLLDAGIKGPGSIRQVNSSAVSGIIVTGIMRCVLFLAAFGVVAKGVQLATQNPAASVFQSAAGRLGYRFFGLVMWSAAITSVTGAAYTSVSFIKTFHPMLQKREPLLITGFILSSTLLFLLFDNPVNLLVMAGALNGLILPVALAVILTASYKKDLMKNYNHPQWMRWAGWLVVVVMGWMSIMSLVKWLK